MHYRSLHFLRSFSQSKEIFSNNKTFSSLFFCRYVSTTSTKFKYRVIYDEGIDVDDKIENKKNNGNPLAKVFYELVLSKLPDLSLLTTTSSMHLQTSDVLVYGGFAHNVAIGKLFDDTPLKVSAELRLQHLRLFGRLDHGGVQRRIDCQNPRSGWQG